MRQPGGGADQLRSAGQPVLLPAFTNDWQRLLERAPPHSHHDCHDGSGSGVLHRRHQRTARAAVALLLLTVAPALAA